MSERGLRDGRPSTPARAVVAGLVALGLVVAPAMAGWPGRSQPVSARPAKTEARPAASARAIPPVRPTRVLVLGDSVMKGADARYGPELPGREVVVDTEVSRSTGAGAEVLTTRGTDWDVVVVLLGHNDGASPGAYQPAARRILDQLRGVRRVSWLTLHEVRPYYPAVNQFLAGLGSEYPNLHIADWNAVARANPDAVAGDGLHLTPQGAGLMADFVARQVEETEYEFAVALTRLTASATTTAPPTTTVPATAPAPTTSLPATTGPAGNNAGTGSEEAAAPARGEDDETEDEPGRASPSVVYAAVAASAAATAVALTRRRRRA